MRTAPMQDRTAWVWLVPVAMLLLVVMSGCNRPVDVVDTVIGKWLDTSAHEITIEFRTDRTARMDADFGKMREQLLNRNLARRT